MSSEIPTVVFDLEYIIEEGLGRMMLLVGTPGQDFIRRGPFAAKDTAAREIPRLILDYIPHYETLEKAETAYVCKHMHNMLDEKNSLNQPYPVYVSVKPKEAT